MDNLVKGVQCYEVFGGISLKNRDFLGSNDDNNNIMCWLWRCLGLF